MDISDSGRFAKQLEYRRLREGDLWSRLDCLRKHREPEGPRSLALMMFNQKPLTLSGYCPGWEGWLAPAALLLMVVADAGASHPSQPVILRRIA